MKLGCPSKHINLGCFRAGYIDTLTLTLALHPSRDSVNYHMRIHASDASFDFESSVRAMHASRRRDHFKGCVVGFAHPKRIGHKIELR